MIYRLRYTGQLPGEILETDDKTLLCGYVLTILEDGFEGLEITIGVENEKTSDTD